MAFIDLEQAGKPPLPSRMHHLTGYPPLEMFWLEFLDGTSAGFWPSESRVDTVVFFFGPTFAACECNTCGGNSSTSAPNSLTSTREPRSSTTTPSIADFCDQVAFRIAAADLADFVGSKHYSKLGSNGRAQSSSNFGSSSCTERFAK